ncbi:hypothetical protein WA1_47650 [Scytonema hofmannii PCC 7110]|uniref:TPM domain-containing protein n=1 Tax=Scytonema hofmannii PCC 7110 TaxID=128403 RepID=A0A139WXY0_9CYAN|nr:TPM domain-containing protein [Scytonema hofmannii]KYC37297.1 hypothetical protein WA1_47650 [Scytonema hofmannii PCC 7110]
MKTNLRKLKPSFWASLFSSILCLCPLSSLALTVQEVPNPRKDYGGWVTDMAGILSNETETQLNQMISQLEAKKGVEIAVVSVPKTAPADSPKKFATELFNHWGIGKKGQNNGVLFLISVGDRRVEIETGNGVEAILPDAKVGNIIDTQIIPKFKKGDFEGGTLAGTKALVVILESDEASSVNKVITSTQETFSNEEAPTDSASRWVMLVMSGTPILFIGSVIYLKRRKIFIRPFGQTRLSKGNYIFLCADCEQPMKKVDKITLSPHLSNVAKTAQRLGSVRFEGWQCPNCSQNLTERKFHIVACESNSPRFRQCPHCQELTITLTKKMIAKTTEHSSGRWLITYKCHSCSFQHQNEEIIPCFSPPRTTRRSKAGSSWGGDSGSFGGDSGSFGGDSGSFGGDSGSFGGGSSDGGGAGGSW